MYGKLDETEGYLIDNLINEVSNPNSHDVVGGEHRESHKGSVPQSFDVGFSV